jgi:hypothetical protein
VKSPTSLWGAKRPLIAFLGSLIFLARTRVKAPFKQAQRIPPIRAFPQGKPLGGATRGFACTPEEGARDAASFRRMRHKSPHRPTSLLSPLTLLPQTGRRFLFHGRELHRRRKPCFLVASSHRHRGGRASHRQGASIWPDFNHSLQNVGGHPQSPSCTFGLLL